YTGVEDSEVPLTAQHAAIVREIADSAQQVSDIIEAQANVATILQALYTIATSSYRKPLYNHTHLCGVVRKLAQFQSHLDCVVTQRARVSSELQQPYHGEHIKLPMAYHADFVTLVKKLLHFIHHTHHTLLDLKALDQATVDEPRLATGLTLMNQTLLACNQYLDNLLEYSALLCPQSSQANPARTGESA
ncbi:hypothetical protein IWQ61_006397, partial [Dispira simplex]